MTTNTSQSDPDAGQAASLAKYQDHARRAAEAWPANKAVLFDALARAGITSVIVNFDGYGDSGQIEQVEVRAGDATAELPAHQIEFVDPVLGDPQKVERSTHTLSDAIETLVYAFLEQSHSGWEDNDGRLWRLHLRRREPDDHARLQRAVYGVRLLLPYFSGRP